MAVLNLSGIIYYLIYLLSSFTSCCQASGQQQQQQQAPVVSGNTTKILIPSLPPQHYQYWLRNHPLAYQEFQKICSKPSVQTSILDLENFKKLHENLLIENPRYLEDLDYGKRVLNSICLKIDIVLKSCWGYESNCQFIYLMPECLGSKKGQAKNEQEQKKIWFNQADFGYILERYKEINKYCSPDKHSKDQFKSSLECFSHFRTCRGDNLIMKFGEIPKDVSFLTNSSINLFKKGDVGGWNCDLQSKRISEGREQEGVLQSWFTELKNYDLIPVENQSKMCEKTFDKQVFIVKPDSPANMYHYFCTFLNIYATMHLNNKFSDNIQIIIWDTRKPRSKFEQMWSVFSKNELITLGDLERKRVCFKKFIFTLMPRMIDGLYYNTPLIPGCSKSGLFDAFNKHVLHKLNINQNYDIAAHAGQRNSIIRITVVGRTTKHRLILNQKDLMERVLNESSDYKVQLIDFEGKNFIEQLKISQNTDILIGIHGAGLTHTLFLPDWAALLEIYNCKDKCYHDLAKLRGVSYFTLEKAEAIQKRLVEDKDELERLRVSQLLGNEKFSNYFVDVDEFMKVLDKAVKRVKENRRKHFKQLTDSSEYTGKKLATPVTSIRHTEL